VEDELVELVAQKMRGAITAQAGSQTVVDFARMAI
jgi:hypothetical protein